jgi:hypothetical protein
MPIDKGAKKQARETPCDSSKSSSNTKVMTKGSHVVVQYSAGVKFQIWPFSVVERPRRPRVLKSFLV